MLAPWKKSYDKSRQQKSRDITLPAKVHLVKAMVFPHVWMWELDYKESWAPKNWCLWTVVLEKTLESPLDSKEIQPVHPKGNQSWIFIGRTHAEVETPILWPPDVKNWLIGKDPAAGKDWRREGKGIIEDEMVGMASPTQWTWVWVSSGSWWWTGKPGVLQSMGSQRVGHNWVTELNPSQLAQVVKNSPANAGDASLIPSSGGLPGGGNGNALQCSCLEHPVGRGAWWTTVMGSQSWTLLTDWAQSRCSLVYYREKHTGNPEVWVLTCSNLAILSQVHNSFESQNQFL